MKRINYKKYSEKLELAWRKDRMYFHKSLADWIDTTFDLKLEVEKKNKLATRLFILGLLLGGLLVESIMLLMLLL